MTSYRVDVVADRDRLQAGYDRRRSAFLSLTSIVTMNTSNTPAISQSMLCLSVRRVHYVVSALQGCYQLGRDLIRW
jgi:hypothetical protein